MLNTLNFNTHMVDWIRKFLSDRVLILQGQSIHTNKGLAQGSALSPILFNIFTTKHHSIRSENTLVFQFADDFFIICAGNSFENAPNELVCKLRVFKNICNRIGLSINPEKAKATHFSNRPKELELSIDSSPIPVVRSIKYLGRYITANNSSEDHIHHIVNNVRRTCSFYYLINRHRSGITLNRAIQLYV